MYKLIPSAFFAAICSSVAGLVWYHSLSDQRQQDTDLLAEELAYKLFATSFAKLSPEQADIVEGHVHRYV